MVPIDPALEFRANYRRYTPEATALLMRITAALGTIRGARVLPAVADELRASARVGTVHYSNLIEGNELPVIDAERATRGALPPDTKAKIELVNYVAALDLIDERVDSGTLELTPDFLKELHGVTTKGLGREDDPDFKPHHEGEWRDGVAVVVDRITGRVMHEGPPKDEIEDRMASMFDWLTTKLDPVSGEPPFVVAGVMHYGITDVHPFADGNGRVARLFQAVVLTHQGVLPGRMFSFEHYYGEDRAAYYEALRSVRSRTFNMEAWLEYFLRGLVEEYERVASTVADLSQFMAGGEQAPLRLSIGQQNGLSRLRLDGRREFTRRDYEEVTGVSRPVAIRELGALVSHGMLTKRGSGPNTRYLFTGSSRPVQSGRPTKWTDATIERALREWLGDRATWPGPDEFAAAGKRSLYVAASRSGGIQRWRSLFKL